MFKLKKQKRTSFWALAGAALLGVFCLAEGAVAAPDIKSLDVDPVDFSSVPGWRSDDHLEALKAFLRSCDTMQQGNDKLALICRKAQKLPQNVSADRARTFFETNFKPNKVLSGGPLGLLTGYYEPVLRGSRVRTEKYNVPLYRRPRDLVGIHSRAMRAAAEEAGLPENMTYARRTKNGLAPYLTREQIETGGLAGKNLELLWLADPVDAFFLHIQGSGVVVLEDGSRVRIGFDGKNGYDYSSVGRALVQAGLLPANKVSLDSVKAWLRANPEKGRHAMWRNRSFIFFRELSTTEGMDGPIGAQGVSLVGGRSLAVDRRYYRLGLPIFLNVRNFKNRRNMSRLMVAQDTGSAIKGAKRGDIFWGSGHEAGEIAGGTYHRGDFYVLLPRDKPSFRVPETHSFSQVGVVDF